MKKTYTTPAMLTVKLGTMNMMAASNPDVTISGGNIDAASVETKEVQDVNVWDEEW